MATAAYGHVLMALPLLLSLLLAGRLARLGAVRLHKEVHKQPEERLDVDEVDDRDLVGEVVARARHHEVALYVHGDELDQLHGRKVLLPPDVTRVGAHKVVHVHDGVDEAIQDDRGVDVTIVGHAEVHEVDL
ncbi:unnamed protein product [Phytophthora fragariaefolia]|uniref:Unnamed protein product n=1 Tax=Phytophthora fragariaefolia TaxID=1490495 RepID=A0A9W6TSS1_9STRA|nr:unnamed protein product [Phytophthora fragariaefolia]